MDKRDLIHQGHATLGGNGWRKRLADATGKNYATVKRWASGELPVPGYVEAILELLRIIPASEVPERFKKQARRRY